MSFLIDAFEPAFMQRALIGGLIAVIATSLVGTWIVLRGLAFLGDALAHGVIPGVALAVLWGFNPALGAFLSALVMSGLVTMVSNRTAVRDDTAIGLLFVGMLALGVTIISKTGSFKTDVTVVLFGDSLGITSADIRNQIIYTSIVVICTVLLYRPFLALTFNEMKAQTLGMSPKLSQAALLALLSLAIVASFQALGTLLVLVCSCSTSNSNLAGTKSAVNYDCLYLVGFIAVVSGLLISFHYGTAGGATMAGISVLEFFVVMIAQSIYRAFQKNKGKSQTELIQAT